MVEDKLIVCIVVYYLENYEAGMERKSTTYSEYINLLGCRTERIAAG